MSSTYEIIHELFSQFFLVLRAIVHFLSHKQKNKFFTRFHLNKLVDQPKSYSIERHHSLFCNIFFDIITRFNANYLRKEALATE